jgi:hypothetical protein
MSFSFLVVVDNRYGAATRNRFPFPKVYFESAPIGSSTHRATPDIDETGAALPVTDNRKSENPQVYTKSKLPAAPKILRIPDHHTDRKVRQMLHGFRG